MKGQLVAYKLHLNTVVIKPMNELKNENKHIRDQSSTLRARKYKKHVSLLPRGT
jgi:hypothetical protein